MSHIKIIKDKITKSELEQAAAESFGEMVKAVVDIEKKVMAIGGSMHADEEAVLLENDSVQENLWGINIYPELPRADWIEFDSMINIRPLQENRSRTVEAENIRDKITQIVNGLIE